MLNKIYELKNDDLALDLIFNEINNLLLNGDFESCDEIIKQLDILNISSCLMCGFLTITFAAKTKLKNRAKLYNDIEKELIKRRGNETAKRLLAGLK